MLVLVRDERWQQRNQNGTALTAVDRTEATWCLVPAKPRAAEYAITHFQKKMSRKNMAICRTEYEIHLIRICKTIIFFP